MKWIVFSIATMAHKEAFAPFIYKMHWPFYQDTLGENIGKALKKRGGLRRGIRCVYPHLKPNSVAELDSVPVQERRKRFITLLSHWY
jgi:hypothetical protein